MPTTSRKRTVRVPRDVAWDLVSDPHHLPRWWPKVRRVEHVGPHGWTKVFITERGRTIRADFTLLESRPRERMSWRQEVEDSPFERLLEDAVTDVLLAGEGEATEVTLVLRQHLRGWARIAPFLVKRGTRRLLDEALDGMQRCLTGEPA